MVFFFDNPSKWAQQFASGFTKGFSAPAKAVKKVAKKAKGGRRSANGNGKKHTLPVNGKNKKK